MKLLLTSLAITLALSVSSVSAHQTKGQMISAKEIPWSKLGNTPIDFSVLWGDRAIGANGTYLRLPAGFETGSHAHTHDYNGITIQGVWEHKIGSKWKRLPVGSYVFQPGKEFHNDRCKGPEACILLIQQNHKGDLLLPEK
ncbi:cupin domain-containing protein [Pelagibaculum spongiae]|uniref:ChrR-like cupin domain-containing protein n=1 Tax=Pelagibaculum spongiae TaxID=2080658 RepID=A0A2V1GYB0_9GAMM|nr:DUF4437 domain-containing protein [Pelagibaculum spongiae]PVZ71766.1 hypothetical protein DC094_01695 [Pelagibaculum spongiae]